MNKKFKKKSLDLRGTPCPQNLVICKLELEDLRNNEYLEVILDTGEPESVVLESLTTTGCSIEIISEHKDFIQFNLSESDN